MNKETKYVLLLGNYILDEAPMMYRYSDSTDPERMTWDGVEFDFQPRAGRRYEAVTVFNYNPQLVEAIYKKNQLYVLMQEPGNTPLEHPFMFSRKHSFEKCFAPDCFAENTIVSPPYLGWFFFHLNHHYLKNLTRPEKNRMISCVASDQRDIIGHRKRLQFVQHLKHSDLDIDFYGKGTQYIKKKEEALLPYHYSIAIENSSKNEYFTEKIQDCFLTYTVPLYYGCKNIGKYFPPKSFIWLDITDHKATEKTIRDVLEFDDVTARMTAIDEARELVLSRYHPLAFAVNQIIPRCEQIKEYERQRIQPFQSGISRPITWEKIFNACYLLWWKMNNIHRYMNNNHRYNKAILKSRRLFNKITKTLRH